MGKLFSKQKQEEMQTERKEVVLTAYSQEHVLQQRMREQQLQHGDRVTASLSPIRLEQNFGKMIMYFCPLQTIAITEVLAKGDNRNLPDTAILDGITVPIGMPPGLYNLKNVQLFSNGTLQVIATADTTLEEIRY